MAVDQGDDVWVLEALKNIDFGGKVVLQLLVELREVDGLYGDEGLGSLVNGGELVSSNIPFKKETSTKATRESSRRNMHDSHYAYPDRPLRNSHGRSPRGEYSDRWSSWGERHLVTSENVEWPWLSPQFTLLALPAEGNRSKSNQAPITTTTAAEIETVDAR